MAGDALQHLRALPLGLWLALSAVSLVASLVLVTWTLVRLPPEALLHAPLVVPGPRWRRWLRLGLRTVAGLSLVVLGAVLALPGIPGQGLLTMLVGLILLEFPGKQRMVRLLMRRPALLHATDRLRARWGKAPLLRPPP